MLPEGLGLGVRVRVSELEVLPEGLGLGSGVKVRVSELKVMVYEVRVRVRGWG